MVIYNDLQVDRSGERDIFKGKVPLGVNLSAGDSEKEIRDFYKSEGLNVDKVMRIVSVSSKDLEYRVELHKE